MGVDRLIRSLIVLALILGGAGTLDEAVYQLAHKAAQPRMMSLGKLNRMLVSQPNK